jgi:hypothetical protein
VPSEGRQTGCQELIRSIVELNIVLGDSPEMPAVPKPSLEELKLEAQSLRFVGKNQCEVSAHIYKRLKGEDRRTVVSAFVVCARVTEKTALTYWYRHRAKPTG